MTYFTADLHLGHENIITHCDRPFASVEEMNKTLIENWNSRVTDRDDIYIVGDLAYRSAESVKNYLKNLRGKKHLIVGNHDKTWMKDVDLGRYFESVSDIKEIKLDGLHITLCHYPMMCWNKSQYGAYLIHGHIHNDTRPHFWPMIRQNPFMLNAGVDVNWFYPVTFEELKSNNEEFKAQAATDVKALIAQAKQEIRDFGGTFVVCPHCYSRPVYNLETDSISCKCGYINDK